MEIPTLAHTTHLLISRISVHQDFFWFSSLLVWSFALIAWWRHPVRSTVWGWLPWAAAAVIATALIEFGMFNPTFDIFIERLVPGTVSEYKPALIDPYWLGDVLIGAAMSTMIAGWGWLAVARTRRPWLRWFMIPVMATVLFVHSADAVQGGLLLAVLALAGAAGLWSRACELTVAKAGLFGAALLPALSSVGPLAAALGEIERAGPPTPLGLGVAFFQTALGCLVLAGLVHGLWRRITSDTHAGFRRDAWRFGLGGVLLLVTGLWLGIQNGRDNRNEIQQNRLRTAAAHALVFDPRLLEPLEDDSFQIVRKSPATDAAVVQSPWLASGVLESARRRLAEVVVATPFLAEARLLVVRNGWLAAVLSSRHPAGRIELLRHATPQDVARWKNPEPYVEEAPVPDIGFDYYCRAPIVAEDGRMLGWLDCVRREYFLSVERRWRVAPFTLTALGLVLLGLVVVQRQSTREREIALRTAAISAESSRIKTAFLAKVSHELRTPLQSILGYSELLQRDPGGQAAPARLNALRQQGELMIRLVNDLIDLSAAEIGAFKLKVRPVAPARLVREVVDSLSPAADAKGLGLHLQVTGDVPPGMALDGDRVRQILVNLVGNAIKYTAQGRVDVTLHAVPAAAGRHRLALVVRDTGPGIPPAEQQRIFAAFSRLEQTATKEGSGLGLALAAALCRTMNGSLEVESDGQHGSCFTAMIEGAPAADPAAEPLPEATPANAAPRVLVVDDSPLVRELFLSSLSARGARCRGAGTAREALAAVATEPPEVIVLDVALPDGDGAELTPRLRQLAPGVRIVGASAHAGAAEQVRALAAGMDLFLTKPVPLEELWRAVVGAPSLASPPIAVFDTPPALRAHLLDEFSRELPARQVALAEALHQEDWRQVRALAHYLRNGALAIQARAVFDAYTGLEAAAMAADAVKAAEWWRACTESLATLRAPG